MGHKLKVNDIDSKMCNGPCQTFHVEGVGTSYIDHCITSAIVGCTIVECDIVDESCNNFSDHLPIVIRIKMCDLGSESVNIKDSVAWHKVTPDQIEHCYTHSMEESMQDILGHINQLEDDGEIQNNVEKVIEEILNDIVTSMKSNARGLPCSHFNKHLKPYWSNELSNVAKANKDAWREWVINNRPRGNHPLFTAYKECKKQFRCEQKQAVYEYEINNMNELQQSQELNHRYFWYLVNKSKSKSNSIAPLKLDTGETITKCEDIREAWRVYFKSLYTPNETNNYDQSFKETIESRLLEMINESYRSNESLLEQVSEKEIDILVAALKSKKAPGYDGITNEHVKYGGYNLRRCITKLFSMIVKYEYVPKLFKTGIIVPIPKGDKNRTKQDNYRGITLLPVFAKLFEKWIMLRLDIWAKQNNIIHKLQGAAQPNCSSLHAAWLVRETIAFNIENKKNVYVGLLDTKKAFDTVWQDGLFVKLFDSGVNGKTWRVLKDLFDGFKCHVRVGAELSEPFFALQGIHQGAPCSMFFFELFENDLLNSLNVNTASAKCGNVTTGGIAYADDIAVIAISKEGIQRLVSTAYNYSRKWRFTFNPTKCSIINFGKEKKNCTNISMGNEIIKVVNHDVHLGVVLANKQDYECEAIEKKTHCCKSICYAAQGLGSYSVPVTPVTSSKLYWNVCIPKLCYGLEIINTDDKSMTCLEKFHFSMAKLQQGLPIHCSNPGSLGTIGWKSIKSHIDIMRLLFLWQILLLPYSCIYKKLCIQRLCMIMYSNVDHCGPLFEIIQTCIKYRLLKIVRDALETGNYMSKAAWKALVTSTVNKFDLKHWKITCRMYKSLNVLDTASVHMSAWWAHAFNDPKFARKNRTAVRLLLNVNMYCQRICPCCDMFILNNVDHVLFECTCNSEVRNVMWDIVRKSIPAPLFMAMVEMSNGERAKFILNGCNTNYLLDWKGVFDSLSNFIYSTYGKYDSMIKVDNNNAV